MTSGTRQGGRPIFFYFGLGKLGRGPRRGSVCAAAGLSLAMLLAGGDLAAQAQKIPYGMVPYGRPVYKNGKRMLWHGAWRGSALGRYARQSVAPAAAKPILALAPEPAQPAVAKEFTVLADPGDARASRMAKDFATVMSARRRAGSRDRRLHFAERSRQGPQDRRGGLRHRLARQPSVQRQGRPGMDEARPLCGPPGARNPGGDRAARSQIDQRPAGKNCKLRRPGQRDIDQRQNVVLPPGRDRESDQRAVAGSARPALGGQGRRGRRPRRGRIARAQRLRRRRSLSHRAHSVVAGFGAGLRSGSRHRRPTGPISSTRPIRSKRSANRWRSSRSMRPRDRRARMRSAELRALFFDNYDGFLGDERDSHWRDVNLAADASWPTESWPRLGAAQSWLDAKKSSADGSLETFRASAKSAAASASWPSAADSDRLYEGLTRWRGLMQ